MKLNRKDKEDIVEFIEKEVLFFASKTVSDKFFCKWSSSKDEYLGQFFKESLILTKKISVKKDAQHLEEEVFEFRKKLSDLLYGQQLDGKLFREYMDVLQIKNLMNNCAEKDSTIYSNNQKKEVKINKGAKVSRVLRHIFSGDLLEELQTEYSKIFNNKELNGYINLSIHPMDYLTMSVNNSGWESCLNIYDGSYRAGTSALMNSNNTIVAYFTTKDSLTETELVSGITWNDKKWRTLLTVGESFLHLNRQYPYSFDEMSEAALDFAEEIFFADRKLSCTKKRSESNMYIQVNEDLMYNDTDYHETKVRLTSDYDVDRTNFVEICCNGTCPVCGEEKYEISKHLECCNCGSFTKCSICGEYCDEDSEYSIYVEGVGYVCESCSENYSYCEFCECYYPHSDLYICESEASICLGCIETNNYNMCEECGYVLDLSNGELCRDCATHTRI